MEREADKMRFGTARSFPAVPADVSASSPLHATSLGTTADGLEVPSATSRHPHLACAYVTSWGNFSPAHGLADCREAHGYA